MERHIFLSLTTSSQWILFVGISLLIYSWIERKRWLQIAGELLFVALALFALWVIKSGMVVVPDVAEGATAPVEARLLTFFAGIALLGIVATIGLVLQHLKSSYAKIPILILVAAGVLLFFMLNHLQRL
ncbi:hypothetical protein [Mangrovibacterium sp.]|uniref:hypothetical protein n=1 Tax=Mangrovibacterium sp. TaxID=1961364 RepID=UPI003563D152